MLQLDDLHRELDREQSARNELKISLKDAAAELEQWKSQYASGALSGPSDDPDAMYAVFFRILHYNLNLLTC